MMALGPMSNEIRETERLRKYLAKILKERHPIHKKLRNFSDKQLMKLCVTLFGKKINGRDRKLKAISDHFFQEFPDAPLTNLQMIMDEDNGGNSGLQKKVAPLRSGNYHKIAKHKHSGPENLKKSSPKKKLVKLKK